MGPEVYPRKQIAWSVIEIDTIFALSPNGWRALGGKTNDLLFVKDFGRKGKSNCVEPDTR